jgi:hypothetical protein
MILDWRCGREKTKDETSFDLSWYRGFSRGVKVDFGWDIEYLFENIDITGA